MPGGDLISGPTRAAERLAALDVLRGVSLLGVCVANLPFMALAIVLADPAELGLAREPASERAVHGLVRAFVDTKFVTLFSLLFGMGLALQDQRGGPRTVRRLVVLLAVGLAHGSLVWPGDILAAYALIGLVALPLRRCGPWTLVALAVPLLLLSGVLMVALSALDPVAWIAFDSGAPSAEAVIARDLQHYRDVYRSGDFGRMFAVRFADYAAGLIALLVVWGPRTLGLFLLGIAVVRAGALRHLDTHRTALVCLVIGGGLTGLTLQAAHAVIGPASPLAVLRCLSAGALYFGGLALAAAYAGAVGLWTLAPERLPGLRARFAAVGRLAFTHYLAQSAIGAVAFNYLGAYDHLDRAGALAFALGVFAVQLAVSPGVLARWGVGPLEWAWRCATYGTCAPYGAPRSSPAATPS